MDGELGLQYLVNHLLRLLYKTDILHRIISHTPVSRPTPKTGLFNYSVKEVAMDDKELAVKVTEVDERTKSNTQRIESLEKMQEKIMEISNDVTLLRQESNYSQKEQGRIIKDIADVKQGIADIKSKPGKRWDAVVEKSLLVAIGAIILYICSKIGF